ncbi:MAG: HTH domain-containing protein [Phycisphaerae bacterium]|nr:MAG: HTH domain-containing protein [Planctomycetota bacterium]KAB2950021.1 MAG: HTH domain-containing protein [Phycisphaerae bacterium]MBE7458332.1 HTH domain-containing protein [Planctomycetia bacterium]MCK6465784.1 HTH domain-containing protein [Phycisphaerae bacterium]MCL4719295.1 HTH domain-containing protein [Phycisphaerae bacterium]
MPANGRPNSDILKTKAIQSALQFALEKRLFSKNPELRKAAESWLKDADNDRSVFGRQMRMIQVLRKGATLEEMVRRLKSSRRTVFRYLNELERAGYTVKLEDSVYRV